jgi:hypothetical protein
MATVIRVRVDFQAALVTLLRAVSDSTGVNLDEYSWEAGRLNDALSDAFASLWSRDEAPIRLTLFESYLPYPSGDSRNPPRTEFECLLVSDPPGPVPEAGDVSVPWMFGDEIDDVVNAVDLAVCVQAGIEDMYDVPGLKDVVREHVRAAYREVRATGQGSVRFVAETPAGPKPVALRIVRRSARAC